MTARVIDMAAWRAAHPRGRVVVRVAFDPPVVAAGAVELLGDAVMGWTQPNRAPAGCLDPRCVHVEERVSTAGGVSVPMDRCVEGHPMHEGCGYHVTAEAVRLRNARDEALLMMARAPFVPRGAR